MYTGYTKSSIMFLNSTAYSVQITKKNNKHFETIIF